MQWYYIEDGERLGPVGDDELRAMVADGQLRPDDLVWNETMGEDWTEVCAIPSLSAVPETDMPGGGIVEAETGIPHVSTPPPLDPRDDEDEIYAGNVSCTTPVGRAWRRMVTILFKPFDFGKWFALGVSAWLASLLDGSGGGSSSFRNLEGVDFEDVVETIENWVSEYGQIIAIGVAVTVVVSISLGLLFLWLRSRGTFMFIENVIHNQCEVGEAWHRNKHLGNSLFRWSIVFSFVGLLIVLILGTAAFFAVLRPWLRTETFGPSQLSAAILLGIIWGLIVIVMAVIKCLRDDFVAPIMYSMDTTCTAAWGHFLGVMRPRFGAFSLYLLFRWLLWLGSQAAITLVILITCCMALFVFAIPYVGAVAILPILVFFRAYSLEYLAQFGKEYRLFEWR